MVFNDIFFLKKKKTITLLVLFNLVIIQEYILFFKTSGCHIRTPITTL